ncbi:DinB family protein [Gracilibacillus xinjiangensis]|uniref:DinB family protein n=1 Tax=Gracilibacillus xinjiangensis TaxID=1193282 RepID=A0ABV8WY47_9BACI
MNKTFNQFSKTIDEVLKLKETSRTKLCEAIREGKWSIREIVGHLYYWDKFNLEKMVPLMVQDADLPKFPDHDQHNEEAVTFLKDYSVETIIDNFVVTRKELTERISSLDGDVRFTIGGGKRKFSGESFVKIFIKHDAHHLKQINEKLHK